MEIGELAAHVAEPEKADHLYRHLSECAVCLQSLIEAREDMRRDLSSEESTLAGQIASRSEKWQSEVVQRFSSRRRIALRLAWAFAAAAALTIVSTVAVKLNGPSTASVARLLDRTYTSGRPFEFRLSLAGYGSLLMAQTKAPDAPKAGDLEALHRAEEEIVSLRGKHPVDAASLRVGGLSELLQAHPQEAVDALQKAAEIDPSDLSTQIDLASALALRGDVQGDAADYARAEDRLEAVLHLDAANATALFDSALVAERLKLYDRALDYWRRFLIIEKSDPWRREAEARVRLLESKKKTVN
jgi:tetratricopeptide (TPR) repeat protein